VFTEIYELFPDAGSLVTSVFTEEAGKTRLTATVVYASKEVRDAVISSGMEKGARPKYTDTRAGPRRKCDRLRRREPRARGPQR
jgi:hypothetical protein